MKCRIRIVLACLALYTLCAAHAWAGNAAYEKELKHYQSLLHRAFSMGLLDPESAHFRNEHMVGTNLCGEFNAKNAFGGYIGWRNFAAWYDPVITPPSTVHNQHVIVEDDGMFQDVWDMACKK